MADLSAKELMRAIVKNLPPEATVEEAMERLHLLAKIEKGVAQADNGETLSHEDVRTRLGL